MKSKKPKSPLKKNKKKNNKTRRNKRKEANVKKNKQNVSMHEKDVSFQFVLNYLTVRLGTPSEVGGSR